MPKKYGQELGQTLQAYTNGDRCTGGNDTRRDQVSRSIITGAGWCEKHVLGWPLTDIRSQLRAPFCCLYNVHLSVIQIAKAE